MSWWSNFWSNEEEGASVGLCLSGGGARGVVHIGYIKALEEKNVPIHAVSGTSMGAIVALLAASGLKADDMLEAFIDLDIQSRTQKLKLLRTVFQHGLNSIYDRLHSVSGISSFDELKYPCFLTASELKEGKPVIFKSGDPVHAALASASIPLIFHPYEIGKKVYVDGGLFNNFPIDPLIENCTHILGSHANHMGEESDLDGTFAIADRIFRLAIFQNVRYRMELCDSYIDPPQARDYATLGFEPSVLRELFQIGYEEGMKSLDGIADVLTTRSEKVEARNKFTDIINIAHSGISEQ